MASLFKKTLGNILEETAQRTIKTVATNTTTIAKSVGGVSDTLAKQIADNARNIAKGVAGETADNAKNLVKGVAGETADNAKNLVKGVAGETADNAKNLVKGVAGETADNAKNLVKGVAGEAADNSNKLVKGVAGEAADNSDTLVKGVAGEAAEKAQKALSLSKNLKNGALGVAAVTGLGLSTAYGINIYNRSKETFDKRNQKQFSLTSISSSSDAMTITFVNTDNLKIYSNETVDIMNVDSTVNGTYIVISQVDMTTITVKRNLMKPAVNLSAMKTGNMKLNADQKNDLGDVIQEDLNKVADLGKGALCNAISFLKLDPYIASLVNGSYVVFLIICIVVLMKIAEVLNMVLGKIPYVKMIVGLIMLGAIVAIHFLIGPYFVLTC
jgi:hypothetical protein